MEPPKLTIDGIEIVDVDPDLVPYKSVAFTTVTPPLVKADFPPIVDYSDLDELFRKPYPPNDEQIERFRRALSEADSGRRVLYFTLEENRGWAQNTLCWDASQPLLGHQFDENTKRMMTAAGGYVSVVTSRSVFRVIRPADAVMFDGPRNDKVFEQAVAFAEKYGWEIL
jgi:hypothetical protein